MTLVADSRAVTPANLVRTGIGAQAYPGLERIGQKVARGMADFLSRLVSAPAIVTVSETSLGERMEGKLVRRTLRLGPTGATMEVALECSAIVGLVDVYYGGNGQKVDETRELLSPAENRLLTRIVEAISKLLAAAWTPQGGIDPLPLEEGPCAAGRFAVQSFTVTFEDRSPFAIHFCYPVATLELFPELQSHDAVSLKNGAADDQWHSRLMVRALDVTFPVRAIFAEPQIPLATLMNLRPGDVIPFCLPPLIGLTVAGLQFARGTAGESNGRAAISIDQI